MTATFDTADPLTPTTSTQAPPNLIGVALGEWLRELIWTGQASRPRALQAELGMSEAGGDCDREMTYKLSGTRRSNINRDPMASMVGSGLHHVIATDLARTDLVGRWLIETPVNFKGIPGSVDAFDTRRGLLVDWKTTSKQKLRKVRADGPPRSYLIQVNLYAAALREQGHNVAQAALVYLPRDGELADLFVYPVALDLRIAEDAVARVNNLRGLTPDNPQVKPNPTRLCGWCDYHVPGSTDLTRGCPGQAA